MTLPDPSGRAPPRALRPARGQSPMLRASLEAYIYWNSEALRDCPRPRLLPAVEAMTARRLPPHDPPIDAHPARRAPNKEKRVFCLSASLATYWQP